MFDKDGIDEKDGLFAPFPQVIISLGIVVKIHENLKISTQGLLGHHVQLLKACAEVSLKDTPDGN